MEQDDVHDDRTEQGETERHVFSDQKERTSDDLEGCDRFQISSGIHGADEFTRRTRHGRHRNEMEEGIGTEDNEKNPKENASDKGGDFHAGEIALVPLRTPSQKLAGTRRKNEEPCVAGLKPANVFAAARFFGTIGLMKLSLPLHVVVGSVLCLSPLPQVAMAQSQEGLATELKGAVRMPRAGIARVWHGRTSAARADEYYSYLMEAGIRKTQAVHGNLGVQVSGGQWLRSLSLPSSPIGSRSKRFVLLPAMISKKPVISRRTRITFWNSSRQ